MSDVFISYSRRDIDFVLHLFDQLAVRDFEPWADPQYRFELCPRDTRLLTRAIEWNTSLRRRSASLRGPELINPKGWLSLSSNREPKATDLHATSPLVELLLFDFKG